MNANNIDFSDENFDDIKEELISYLDKHNELELNNWYISMCQLIAGKLEPQFETSTDFRCSSSIILHDYNKCIWIFLFLYTYIHKLLSYSKSDSISTNPLEVFFNEYEKLEETFKERLDNVVREIEINKGNTNRNLLVEGQLCILGIYVQYIDYDKEENNYMEKDISWLKDYIDFEDDLLDRTITNFDDEKIEWIIIK